MVKVCGILGDNVYADCGLLEQTMNIKIQKKWITKPAVLNGVDENAVRGRLTSNSLLIAESYIQNFEVLKTIIGLLKC
ncbi:hypothetical protein [Clostridium perfringens]